MVVDLFAWSDLERIQDCFRLPRCRELHSICIPSLVDAIDGRAFSYSGIQEIRIAEGNRHFRVSGAFLLSFDGRLLLLYFGRSSIVDIEDDIEVICKAAFSIFRDFSDIRFGCESKLRRIEWLAFSSCRQLHSICIPSLVDTIDGAVFSHSHIGEIRIAEGNRHFRVSGDFLLSFDGRFLFQYFGRSSIINIDDDIEVICGQAFSIFHNFSEIRFGYESTLRRIESFAFSSCDQLHSIYIPSLVDTIDGSAFSSSAIEEIRIAEGNRHFRVSGDFVLSFDGRFLFQYFGRCSIVDIEDDIEVICGSAFSIFQSFSEIQFGSESNLRRIERHP
jgi:hypothetical protein